MCFKQAYGHILIDEKWLHEKVDHVFTNQLPLLPNDFPNIPPQLRGGDHLIPYCIFLTSKKILDSQTTRGTGLILQYQLPCDLYPTFIGMSCSINYSFALTWESDENKSTISFPFRVSGIGSCDRSQDIRLYMLNIIKTIICLLYFL